MLMWKLQMSYRKIKTFLLENTMITLKESSKNIKKRPKNTTRKIKCKKKNKPIMIKRKTTKTNLKIKTIKLKNTRDHRRKK